MAINLRPGNGQDLDFILKSFDERDFFPGYAGMEVPSKIRPVIKRSFLAHKSFISHPELYPFLIAENGEGERAGYLIINLLAEESITREKQVHIYDYHISSGQPENEIFRLFTDYSEKIALENSISYIVAEVCRDDHKGNALFGDSGFNVEMNRIIKGVESFSLDQPPYTRFSGRSATEEDRLFLMLLAAKNTPFLIPSSRTADQEIIKNMYFETIAGFDMENPQMKIFVAEDRQTYMRAGYIIIKTAAVDAVSEKPLSYIYDLSIDPSYWGKHTAQFLVKYAQNCLTDMGVKYLIGDTAQSNPRPFLTALKTLRFTHFSSRWVKTVNL